MKRVDLLKQMAQLAKESDHELEKLRDRGDHTVYVINGRRIPIPRHREINEMTAKKILNDTRKATGQ